jgi:hypothetical protein
MEFPTQLSVADLALGLTLVIGNRFRDVNTMNAVRLELLQCTQANIYEKAEEISARYGRRFQIDLWDYGQMEDARTDCFFIGNTPMGDICGAFVDGQVMTPKSATGFPQPLVMKVFTTVPMTKH